MSGLRLRLSVAVVLGALTTQCVLDELRLAEDGGGGSGGSAASGGIAGSSSMGGTSGTGASGGSSGSVSGGSSAGASGGASGGSDAAGGAGGSSGFGGDAEADAPPCDSDAAPDGGACTPRLQDLTASRLTVAPNFDPATQAYTVTTAIWRRSIAVTATADSGDSITIDGQSATSGTPIIVPLPALTTMIDVVVTRANISNSYTLSVTRGAPLERLLTDSQADVDDQFGISVALSDDGNTLAIGAPEEDSDSDGPQAERNQSGANEGAAFVFVRSGSNWIEQSFIKAERSDGNDFFGTAVALSADGNTLAVSTRDDDQVAGNSGAVDIFLRFSALWVYSTTLKASNPGNNDRFGSSISLSDDGLKLAVGAPEEDSADALSQGNNSAANSGAVYTFLRSAPGWSQTGYLKASNIGAGDEFGTSVAWSGDGTRLIVGASFEDSASTGVDSTPDEAATDNGAAYVFEDGGSGFAQTAYLKPTGPALGGEFGSSVAIDLDGDTIAVGAKRRANEEGAVFVFSRAGSTWSQQQLLTAAEPGTDDKFGQSVSLSNDGNILAVSADEEETSAGGLNPTHNNVLSKAGAAYVLQRTGTTWAQVAFLKPIAPVPEERFGAAVALCGDGSTLVVGVELGNSMRGSVYVYD